MSDEFLSFEKAMAMLHFEESDLKKLVSEGEIRAFRDQDKMKFRREDIERFRKRKEKEAQEAQEVEEPVELLFEEQVEPLEEMPTLEVGGDGEARSPAQPAPVVVEDAGPVDYGFWVTYRVPILVVAACAAALAYLGWDQLHGMFS